MANLKYQIKRKLGTLKAFGQSKHQAKKDIKYISNLLDKKVNSVKVDKIYSKSTYKNYMKITQKFGDWMQKTYKDIKNINDIKKCHAEEYLIELKNKGLRSATLQTYTAAIAKVLNCNCNELNKQLPTKRSQRPNKSRNGTSKHFSIERHKDLIEFVKNTGLRASEAQQITAEQMKTAMFI